MPITVLHSYRTRDARAKTLQRPWPAGPWDDEPDKIQGRDEATGLPVLAVRNRLGAWCGYVGVTEGHPLFGRPYDAAYRVGPPHGDADDDDSGLEVHGGLTFGDYCQESTDKFDAESEGVCHLAEAGQPERVYWLGFDCAHGGDIVPGIDAWVSDALGSSGWPQTYRDLAYVMAECERLAAQLAAHVAPALEER